MYCEKCNIEIDGHATVCPLCHTPLVGTKQENRAFPLPKPDKISGKTFSLWYIFIMILLVIPCVVVNLIYTPNFYWWVIALIVLSYIGFFIRSAIIGQARFRQKLITQAVVLTALFFAVYLVNKGNYWILITWQPAVYITSYIILAGHMIKFPNYAKANVVASYVLGILGQIPIITAYIIKFSPKTPSIIASAMGVLLVIIISLVFRKNIVSELKKFFQR